MTKKQYRYLDRKPGPNMLDIAQREAIKRKKLFPCPFASCIFKAKSIAMLVMHIENNKDHVGKVKFILLHFKERV